MKRFIKAILIFGISFFVLEKIFYIFLVVSPTLEVDDRLEKVIKGEVNKDLIILGSSRGARNILASQIKDTLGISTYNLSYPGSDVEFHEFLLRTLLKFNEPPEMVILVMDDPYELLPSNNIKFRLDRLYPLSKYNHINNELIKRGEKSFLSKFFVLARVNRKNFDLEKRQLRELDTFFENKSMPISFQKRDVDFDYDYDVDYAISNESESKLAAFLDFQHLCAINKIQLLIVFPPNFEKHSPAFEKRIRFLSDKDVSFYVYDQSNPVYKDETYFYDESHLKKNGAVVFTEEVIEYIKAQQIGCFSSRYARSEI